jgi:hypothetical protein
MCNCNKLKEEYSLKDFDKVISDNIIMKQKARSGRNAFKGKGSDDEADDNL